MGACSGIVLCGGRSSRMGRPKAWLPWSGRPMLVHVVERLREVVDDVVVVAAPDQHLPDVDARVVADREAGLGPLAGLREGLAHARGDLAFVTATDAPYLTAAFVRKVLGVGRAAAPVVEGRVQPLSAAYPTRGAALAEGLMEAGKRRPLDLLEALDYELLDAESLPDLDSVRGFNTPDAYLGAIAKKEMEEATPAEGAGPSSASVTLELLGRARARVGKASLAVSPGRLRDVLAVVAAEVELVDGDRVARPYAVSLDGRSFLRDVGVPIGPGEHVIVLDSAVGG